MQMIIINVYIDTKFDKIFVLQNPTPASASWFTPIFGIFSALTEISTIYGGNSGILPESRVLALRKFLSWRVSETWNS
ncbi:hypothetical protein [Castellaniella sp.]|uniref:hypothetical protein n=1 Tax=Castellaniella sp. TaxID=1955812 RepID=UPI002A35D49B|nr:hypothetical protein [Castellaniella sp.]